jgi:hypothetical protein
MLWVRTNTRSRPLGPRRAFQLLLWLGALVSVLGPSERIEGAAIVLHDMSVRVYDNTGLSESSRRAGLATATDIFNRAEVEVGWVHCPAKCGRPLGHRQLILRLTRSRATATELGASLIDPAAQAGRLATVYVDQVDLMARRSHLDRVTILGRAIAHEVGHLLLGTTEHTRTGLMRGLWTTDELRRNAPDDWHFTPMQRMQFRARLGSGDPFRWNAGLGRPASGRTGGGS